MNVFDAEIKILGTEVLLQDTVADLNSGIHFIVLFTAKKPK